MNKKLIKSCFKDVFDMIWIDDKNCMVGELNDLDDYRNVLNNLQIIYAEIFDEKKDLSTLKKISKSDEMESYT